jgi:hypothetical protein
MEPLWSSAVATGLLRLLFFQSVQVLPQRGHGLRPPSQRRLGGAQEGDHGPSRRSLEKTLRRDTLLEAKGEGGGDVAADPKPPTTPIEPVQPIREPCLRRETYCHNGGHGLRRLISSSHTVRACRWAGVGANLLGAGKSKRQPTGFAGIGSANPAGVYSDRRSAAGCVVDRTTRHLLAVFLRGQRIATLAETDQSQARRTRCPRR